MDDDYDMEDEKWYKLDKKYSILDEPDLNLEGLKVFLYENP